MPNRSRSGARGEGARENARREQALESLARVFARGEAEQARSAEDAPASLASSSASSRALSLPSRARVASSQSESASARAPIAIAGPLTGQGPRAARKGPDNIRRSDGESEAKPRQPVGLAERAQDDGAARGQRRLQGFVGAVEIGEGLVDDQHSAAQMKPRVKIKEVGARVIRPSGLLGLTTIATSRSSMASSEPACSTGTPAAAKAAAWPP